MGFMLLAHAFTGPGVMREGGRQVMGASVPGRPRSLTAAGWSTAAHAYRVYSFDAEAFPTGPLRISLLFATG
jgi:hypothetical protein